MYSYNKQKGFGLVETIVAVAVFSLIALSGYGGFVKILEGIQILKVKNAALGLLTEQVEIVRNMPYADIGLVDGVPSGLIQRNFTETRGGFTFNISANVRNIDDTFDGEAPDDLAPADYKLVQFEAVCVNCRYDREIALHTRVSPQGLESQGNNGSLIINALDSQGLGVPLADITIFNDSGTSTINITDEANLDGEYKLVDVPPGTEAYEITVTKDGYSTERTYQVGDPNNPGPYKVHANVVTGGITEISFIIDQLSSLDIYTKDMYCENIPSVSFNMFGGKEIGYEVLKYDEDLTTDGSGNLLISDLEWDEYNINLSSSTDRLLGSSSILPLSILPGVDSSLDLIIGDVDDNSLLVQVTDSLTGDPIDDAVVTLTKDAVSKVLTTGKSFINQTDWSGGDDQEMFEDVSRYATSTDIVDGDDITIENGKNSAVLISSIIDMGVGVNYDSLHFSPQSQPIEVGNNPIKFQLASNDILDASTTWEFLGPNGATSTYYTTDGEDIYFGHDNDRYIRYVVYLETDSVAHTPTLSEVYITYDSSCNPSGQVLFTDLDGGSYELQVEKDGYETYMLNDISTSEVQTIFNVTLGSS